MNKQVNIAIFAMLAAVAGVGLWKVLPADHLPVTSQSANVKQQQSQQKVAINYQEGVHWERLDSPFFVGKNAVHNFFWYGCDHCLSLHKELKNWMPANPSTNIIPVPVTFGSTIVDAQDFYAMKLAGLDDELIMNYMEYRQSSDWRNGGGVAKYLLEQGVSESIVLKVKMLSRSENVAEQIESNQGLLLDGKVSGVPALVIGGKYKILMRNLSENYSDLFNLMDYLLSNQP